MKFFFTVTKNLGFKNKNNVSHMAPLSRNAGMQALPKRVHRVGQPL